MGVESYPCGPRVRSILFLLLTLSLLLPPSVCSCPGEALRAAEPAPAAGAPKPSKKCCSRCGPKAAAAPAPEVPAKKDHAPGCPLVRKLDRVRSVEAAQVIDAPDVVGAVEGIAASTVLPAPLIEEPLPRPGGPPRRLLFCTFLF